MALASVTSSNISYQPKDNIKQHILNNLTDKRNVFIYDQVPDLTSIKFGGFPFIVLPYDELVPDNDTTLRQNIQYSNLIEGTIYHDKTKLGDNRMRIIKQDLINAFTTFTNKQILAGYKITEVEISFLPMSQVATTMNQFAVVEQDFLIRYTLDIDMGA